MIAQFASTPWQNTRQHDYHVRDVLRYLRGRILNYHGITMLDIGKISPLTLAVKERYEKLIIWNTDIDIDTEPIDFLAAVDYVLYSHTIEHQFNPLYTLLEIYNLMKDDSVMFIILPRRGKLLWDKGHYHEIDHYRMKLLLERAGYEIISYELHKAWRPWWFYLTGIRPLMRLFFEFNAYYEVKKK